MKVTFLSVFLAVSITAIFFCSTCKTQSGKEEMPVTTSSRKALKAFTEGRDHYETAQFIKAAALFKKATDLDPEFALAHMYLSFSDGSYFPEEFEKALSFKDKVSEGERILLEMFNNQRERNSMEMKRNSQKLLELYPENKRIYYILGSDIFYNDDEKAFLYLRKTIALDENFGPAYHSLGRKYQDLRNLEEAEKNFLKYAELLPNHPHPLQTLGTLYRDEGKFDKALEFYNRMLQLDSSSSAYWMIGNCYTFTGDFQRARENYLKGYEVDENESNKLISLNANALSFIFEGDKEGALMEFKKLGDQAEKYKRYQNVIDACRNQLWVSLMFNDVSGAQSYLEKSESLIKSLELNEVTRKNYEDFNPVWRGFLLTYAGDYDEAEKEFKNYQALMETRQNPGEMRVANTMFGFLRVKQQRYDEAIDFLLKGGNWYNTWYYLGEAYEGKGDTENAKEYFKKVASANLLDMNLASVRSLAIEKLKQYS